jgi:hypothetical protein
MMAKQNPVAAIAALAARLVDCCLWTYLIYCYVLDDGNDLSCEEMTWNLLVSQPIRVVFIRRVCMYWWTYDPNLRTVNK